MEENSLPHQKVVFVCVNERPPDAPRICCAKQNGAAVRDKLKALVKDHKLQKQIRISQTGCMDKCEDGANVMIFPDNVWLSAVTEADAETIFERLRSSL